MPLLVLLVVVDHDELRYHPWLVTEHTLEVEELRPVAEVDVEAPMPMAEVEEPKSEVGPPTSCAAKVEAAVEPLAWPSPLAPVVGLLPPTGPAA
jgi:hypothetical protein